MQARNQNALPFLNRMGLNSTSALVQSRNQSTLPTFIGTARSNSQQFSLFEYVKLVVTVFVCFTQKSRKYMLQNIYKN